LGFGIGGLSTEIDDDIAKMDGECFRYSVEALENTKEKQKWTHTKSNLDVLDLTLNSQFQLMELVIRKFRSNQIKVIFIYLQCDIENKMISQREISEVTGIPQAHISRVFNNYGWQNLKEILDEYSSISRLFNKYTT
jgi:predicted XRE-type DNA-binding protein